MKERANLGDALGDTFTAIENVTGGTAGDNITGDTNANVLDGGAKSAKALAPRMVGFPSPKWT